MNPDDLYVSHEIATQPECWERAAAMSDATGLPEKGERVAVIGCGTSWFMAQAYASLRELGGQGETEAFTASEFLPDRRWDRVMAICRSGTTTEVGQALASVHDGVPTVELTAVPGTWISDSVQYVIDLSFADEQSVVQTRFATSALALLRAHLGEDLGQAIADGREAVRAVTPEEWVDAQQIAFLGKGWTIGLANEAALKCREASLSFVEAYPAMDYRHGPISLAEPGRLVWMLGEPINGLEAQVAETGATWIHGDLDPMADLVRIQRLAVARGLARGLDPDHPRHLTRSVILG